MNNLSRNTLIFVFGNNNTIICLICWKCSNLCFRKKQSKQQRKLLYLFLQATEQFMHEKHNVRSNHCLRNFYFKGSTSPFK
jgi:hypothetical protein